MQRDGQELRCGDRISHACDAERVVFVVEDDAYTPEYPKESWSYLGRGVMLEQENGIVVLLYTPNEDLRLLSLADTTPRT